MTIRPAPPDGRAGLFLPKAPRPPGKPLAPFRQSWQRYETSDFCRALVLASGEARNVRIKGASMIRSELIQKIADENPHLFRRDVERIVNTVFDEIIDAMARGDRVELRGFGAFSVKKRDARTGRNPRTGDSVEVEEKHVPFFKTGKLLRDRLNGEA